MSKVNWYSLLINLLSLETTESMVTFFETGKEPSSDGIAGNIIWDWLQISVLWISQPLRGQGFGHQLLERAEEKARNDGLKFSRLNTFEFEAREFYESHGYKVYAQTDNFPTGHTQFHLMKEL